MDNPFSFNASSTPDDILAAAVADETISDPSPVIETSGSAVETEPDRSQYIGIPGEDGRFPCLICGKTFKKINGHLTRSHGIGKPNVAGIKAVPKSIDMSTSVGMSLTIFLLSMANRVRPGLKLPISPDEKEPGSGFLQRAAAAHQLVINEYLGAYLEEYGPLVSLGFIYAEFAMFNYGALSGGVELNDPIDDADNREAGSGQVNLGAFSSPR